VLGFLAEWSVDAVRELLAPVIDLRDDPLVLDEWVGSHPQWAAGGALIGSRYVAKFACSAVTAERIDREARVLNVLRGRITAPELVVASTDPVFFVTRLVPGEPLSRELLATGDVDEVGAQLAAYLADLHRPEILATVTDELGAAPGFPVPGPQATTDQLRTDLPGFLPERQVGQVRDWCDWADEVLAAPAEPVLVHGDFHGHNQIWDDRLRLRLVADLETCGAAEPEYDLRYLPAFGAGVPLLTATAEHYSRATGRPLRLDRAMAWHLLSFLGDSLWRSQAGLPLLLPVPGGGTPADYVDVVRRRFDALGMS